MPAYRTATSGKDRTVALIAVAGVHAALIGLLLSQHQRPMPKAAPTDTTLIDVRETPPPPPETVKIEKPRDVEGAAGRKAQPTEVVAPPSKLPAPSPVAAAPVAGTGTAPSTGAAASGSGAGAGGMGTGTGGGGGGSGAQWISGGLRDSDYPQGLVRDRVGGTVSVRFTVLTSGRIADCRIVRSSGNSVLDGTTCRLLTERLRFRPATDGRGQPMASSLGSDFTWGVRVRR